MARTVLVVDDDPLVLEVTAAMLDDIGCDVVTASTGKQALVLTLDASADRNINH
jgi:two-component system cell cycle response regulator CpdR